MQVSCSGTVEIIAVFFVQVNLFDFDEAIGIQEMQTGNFVNVQSTSRQTRVRDTVIEPSVEIMKGT